MSRARRPTAAMRTICAFCRSICGGTCAAMSPRPESPQRERSLVAAMGVSFAVKMAEALMVHHGVVARGAAFVASRRFGVPARDVLIHLPPMRPRAWREEPEGLAKVRPTARPTRAPDPEIDSETREQDKRGAA